MSRIKELKENSENSINIVNILSMFTPDVKNNTKYIETLLRVFQNDVVLQTDVLNKRMKEFGLTDDQINTLNKHEKVYLTVLINEPENREAFKKFYEFCLFNEKNAIENNDLQTYNSFDDIFSEYKKAKHKEEMKEMEKQVIKVIDDENWLAIIPLTYESSLKYGSNTRWCTASKENPSYYSTYTKDGVLIYCLNKKTEEKFAGYCKVKNVTKKDISFWSAEDNKIDGYSCGFSSDLFTKINEIFKPASNGNVETIEELRRKKKLDKESTSEKKTISDTSGAVNRNAVVGNGLAAGAATNNVLSDYDQIFNTIVHYMEENNRR